MIKAEITTPEAMAQDQIREDISRTPLERLDLAFRLSDFALEIQKKRGITSQKKSSAIQWIELQKI